MKQDTEYTHNYVLRNHSWKKCGQYLEHALNQTIDHCQKNN
jgi:hypothetical protein